MDLKDKIDAVEKVLKYLKSCEVAFSTHTLNHYMEYQHGKFIGICGVIKHLWYINIISRKQYVYMYKYIRGKLEISLHKPYLFPTDSKTLVNRTKFMEGWLEELQKLK